MTSTSVQTPHPCQLYDQVWGVTNGCFFDVGALRNWGGWRYRFNDRIRSVQDAIDASNEMLSSLRDSYSRLRSADETEERAYRETADPVVFSRLLPGGIALIEVTSFNVEGADRELAAVLDSLPLRHIRGIILDLRRNAGGILREANRAAGLFLDRGITMRDLRRVGFEVHEELWRLTPSHLSRRIIKEDAVKHETESRWANMTGDTPIALLVGSGTASAAEVFAAALAENGRAILIGSETAGKGITQSRIRLLFGATLDLTTGRFFSPHGHWFGDAGQTCAYGLRPHIEGGYDPVGVAMDWIHAQPHTHFAA